MEAGDLTVDAKDEWRNTKSSNALSAFSSRLLNLRNKIRAGDRDLLNKAALVLFVTGAVLIAVVLCAD